MNDEEKAVLELSMDHGVGSNSVLGVQAILNFAQAILDQEAAKHKAEVAKLERRVAGLRKNLCVIYAKYEEGADCYEDPEDYTWHLGKAVKLSLDEEDEIVKAISDTSETAKRHDALVKKEARKEYRNELLPLMVERFLSWKLPKNFHPDCGISFVPEYNKEYMESLGKPPSRHEPMGTNLFNADQARGMVVFMLGGISDEQVDETVTSLKDVFGIANDELEGMK